MSLLPGSSSSVSASSALSVESSSVIQLMLQFLRENQLHASMRALQDETNVTLNTVDNADKFTEDIKHGRQTTHAHNTSVHSHHCGSLMLTPLLLCLLRVCPARLGARSRSDFQSHSSDEQAAGSV